MTFFPLALLKVDRVGDEVYGDGWGFVKKIGTRAKLYWTLDRVYNSIFRDIPVLG